MRHSVSDVLYLFRVTRRKILRSTSMNGTGMTSQELITHGQKQEKLMKPSNTQLRNSCDLWLLPAMVLASFGLLIVVGVTSFGFLSIVPATNAAPTPDPALTGHFGRMFHLPPFAPPTDAVRDALMQLGTPGGIMDANDDLAAGPVALIVDPNLSLINRNNPNDTAGITFFGQFRSEE